MVLLGLIPGCCHHRCTSNEVADGVEVRRADVPAAVLATFDREAAGGKLGDIERTRTRSGKPSYTAEITINGEEWETEVGEDGKLLGWRREDEEDGQDEDKD